MVKKVSLLLDVFSVAGRMQRTEVEHSPHSFFESEKTMEDP